MDSWVPTTATRLALALKMIVEDYVAFDEP